MATSHPLLNGPALTVAVGSKNPCKVSAVSAAFKSILRDSSSCALTVSGYGASSGVSDQPMSSAETLLGAKNRAIGAAELHVKEGNGEPDFSVGLEGGIVSEGGGMWCMAWMACYCPSETHHHRQFGIAQTGMFPLPPLMAAIVLDGEELGTADDVVTKRENSKQGGGTVGVLTDEIISRGAYYEHALVLAMSKFISQDVFFKGVGEDGVTVDKAVMGKLLEEYKSKK